MSWPSTIKTGIETAIAASSNATLKAADVFDRPERPEDQTPDADGSPQIFLVEQPMRTHKLADGVRFKILPFEIVLVFAEPASSTLDDEADAVEALKSDLEDALRSAVLTTNPWSTSKIDDAVLQVDHLASDFHPQAPGPIAGHAQRGKLHRIVQSWEFLVNAT